MKKDKYESLVGRVFGKLTVLKESIDENGNIKKYHRSVIWMCRCECGNIIYVNSNTLKTGDSKSCGKCNYENLTGRVFGKLTVLKEFTDGNGNIVKNNKNIVWCCRCECGNIRNVAARYLKSGSTKACEKCNYESKHDYENLTDKFFGKLIVLKEATDENGNIIKNKGNIMWACQCECGNIIDVRTSNLKSGNTRSCGCLSCTKNISQSILTKLLNKILCCKVEQNYRKLNWLRNPQTNYNLEADIYIPSLNIIIEYDGIQHFKSVECFGGEGSFKKRQELDKIKNELIQQHIASGGEDIKYFIRFSYKEPLTEQYIKQKINNIIGV